MGAGRVMGSRGVAGSPGPQAALAASLLRELLAAIDVASVPVCVSSCVPAAGRPCPPCPATCRPQALGCRHRSPPSRELHSGLPLAAVVLAVGQVGCLGPGWLCRGGVPLSPLQIFCTQGLEQVVVVHLQAGLHSLGSRGRGFEWPHKGPHGSLCHPRHPFLAVTPSSNPGYPPLGLAGRRQQGQCPWAGCSKGGWQWQELLVAQWPRSDKVMGCGGRHNSPPGFGHPGQWGGWGGAPRGGSTQSLAWLGLPFHQVGAVGTPPSPPAPQFPHKGL